MATTYVTSRKEQARNPRHRLLVVHVLDEREPPRGAGGRYRRTLCGAWLADPRILDAAHTHVKLVRPACLRCDYLRTRPRKKDLR